jgi:hypothetical protein
LPNSDFAKDVLPATPTSAVRLNPELPAELERIINKALEKDREVRFQSKEYMQRIGGVEFNVLLDGPTPVSPSDPQIWSQSSVE